MSTYGSVRSSPKNEKGRFPRTTPAPSSPGTEGCLRRAATSPPSFAAARMIATASPRRATGSDAALATDNTVRSQPEVEADDRAEEELRARGDLQRRSPEGDRLS